MEIEDKLLEVLNIVGIQATYNMFEKNYCGVYLENIEIFEFSIDTYKIGGLLTFKVAKGDCGFYFEELKHKLQKVGMLIKEGGIRLKIEDGTRFKSFNFEIVLNKEIEKIKEVFNGYNS